MPLMRYWTYLNHYLMMKNKLEITNEDDNDDEATDINNVN